MKLRVAVCNWELRAIGREQEFWDHLDEVIAEASSQVSDLLVLPELPCLELLAPCPEVDPGDVGHLLAEFADAWKAHLTERAMEHDLTIVGTQFEERDGVLHNVLSFAGRDGSWRSYAKNRLTQYELREWGVEPGSFVAAPKNGVAGLNCYDCEFPESARELAEAGMLLLCVPAFTETRHGFQRVRFCCSARAVENQVFVAHASLVGSLGREPVPSTYGSSAILAPSVPPFPESAILAETPMNRESVVVAEVDFEVLIQAREEGEVRNWYDRLPYGWELRDD